MKVAGKYLLDTNICIYAMNRSSRSVMQKMLDAGPDALVISSMVAAELAFGVARSNEAYRAKNKHNLQRFVGSIEVLPWTHAAMWHFGEQRADDLQRGFHGFRTEAAATANVAPLAFLLHQNRQ